MFARNLTTYFHLVSSCSFILKNHIVKKFKIVTIASPSFETFVRNYEAV